MCELTHLVSLEVSGMDDERNAVLKSLYFLV
jgi:hypothetical protein